MPPPRCFTQAQDQYIRDVAMPIFKQGQENGITHVAIDTIYKNYCLEFPDALAPVEVASEVAEQLKKVCD